MGEPVLILAFVVIIIGGIGSVKGALVGALLVGITDTLGRVFLPQFFGLFLPPSEATSVGASLAAMAIYLLMAGSEEHTSELQSLMRISYAVFCLTKKNKRK